MKKLPLIALAAMIVLACNANAQTDQPYTNGPVWNLSFIKAKPGFFPAYMKNLAEGWSRK